MKTLTVIIPLYNEEKRLNDTFSCLKKFKGVRDIGVEKFVLVNDGSKDNTLKLLRNFKRSFSKKLANKAEIEIVAYPVNHGRGYAVMQGAKRVKSDYGMFLDGDMSIPLGNLENFSKFMNQNYDLLVGSKKINGTVTLVKRNFIREFIGEVHSRILSFVLGIKLADFTGGFKVFSKSVCEDIFPRLTQERWGLDPEIIYVTNRLNYSIKELPIVWSHISKSSKVNLIRDILRAFKEMATIKLNDWKNIYNINPQPAMLNKAFSLLVKFSLLLFIWPKKSS